VLDEDLRAVQPHVAGARPGRGDRRPEPAVRQLRRCHQPAPHQVRHPDDPVLFDEQPVFPERLREPAHTGRDAAMPAHPFTSCPPARPMSVRVGPVSPQVQPSSCMVTSSPVMMKPG
jgi:hypothetical protein